MFRPLEWVWGFQGGWLGWLIVAGCWACAAGCFGLVALLVVFGIPWARVVYAEDPYAHLAAGLGFLFLAWVVRVGWRSPARAWGRLLGKGAMLLVSLALSFALGELLVRTMLIRNQEANSLDRLKHLRAQGKKLPVRSSHPLAHIITPSDHSRLVYELRPDLELKFGHRLLRTNRDGMRDDRNYDHAKPEGVVRIVGIGDSGMFGWGVEQNEDYLSVLRSNLAGRTTGRRYEVLNLAVPGYNTQLELEALRFKGLPYRPDVVVVGWCDNDFALPMFLLEKENFRRRDVSFLHLLMFKRDQYLNLIAGAHFRDQREFDQSRVAEELVDGSDFAGVEHALRELKALGAQEGFRVLAFGSMHPKAVEIFRRVEIPYCNLREHIPGTRYPKEWAVQCMHPRAEGHRTLAGYLERELDRLGWLGETRAAGQGAASDQSPRAVAANE